jgi:hypothetical protein
VITKLLYIKVKTESTPEKGIGRRNRKITGTAFHQKSFGLTKRETQKPLFREPQMSRPPEMFQLKQLSNQNVILYFILHRFAIDLLIYLTK